MGPLVSPGAFIPAPSVIPPTEREPFVPARAAIVTGASSGIGLAIARVLAQEGHAITMSGRRADKLQAAVEELTAAGMDVHGVPANVGEEAGIQQIVAEHRERYGRLDVLVNNAGVGIGQAAGELTTKYVDMQIAVNLRAMILFYRECAALLRAAAAEHRNALVVNMSSMSGKRGEGWLSVYSATKHGIVGFTQAMNRELAADGIKSCALCPAFVDTAMSDWIKGQIEPEQMIRVEDVAEAVRFLLRTSPTCVIPEIQLVRPGDAL
jgi:NAD(P)-dependent dehydrogenase (short-subunit alcohol dehydrogenase family)